MSDRNVEFKLRLSPEEHEALRAHAEGRGLKPTDVLRLHIRGFVEFARESPPKKNRSRSRHG